MSGSLMLGLDLGTSKLAAAALDGERVLATASVANDADLPDRPPDWHEQDPQRILELAGDLVRSLLARPELASRRVAGVALCGQMHGVLLADQRLRPVTPLITWRDQRTAGALPELDAEAPARCGCVLSAGYGGATLGRLAAEPPAGAAVALSLADWLVAELTGRVGVESGMAASWGLLDVRRLAWDEPTLAAAGVPAAWLPPLAAAYEPLGRACGALAQRWGLGADTWVLPALGDNQASVVGAAGLQGDELVVNLGTGGQVSVPAPEPAPVAGLELRPMPFGGWLHVGASLAGGWAYAYLRSFFQEVAEALCGQRPSEEAVYEQMNAWCLGDAGGLRVDPRFAGARNAPEARGAVTDIDRANLTPAHLTRAVLEGVASELHALVTPLELGHLRGLVASGNAVRRNPAALPLLERTFGLPGRLSEVAEEAAVGAARCAAAALG